MGILKRVGLEWKTLLTVLTWMIWGYPYFRKPPYTAHQDLVDTLVEATGAMGSTVGVNVNLEGPKM